MVRVSVGCYGLGLAWTRVSIRIRDKGIFGFAGGVFSCRSYNVFSGWGFLRVGFSPGGSFSATIPWVPMVTVVFS